MYQKEHQAKKIPTYKQVLFLKQVWIATLVRMEPLDLIAISLKPRIKKGQIQLQMSQV